MAEKTFRVKKGLDVEGPNKDSSIIDGVLTLGTIGNISGASSSILAINSLGSVNINLDTNTNDTNSVFKIKEDGTDFFTMDNDGNITIVGDLSLGENKKIYFDSTDTYIYADTDSSEDLHIGADGHIELEPDNDLIVKVGSTEYVRFDGSEQRVGIGTTSPAVKLDVNGMLNITQKLSMTNSGGYSRIEMQGSSGAYIDMKNATTDDYDVRFLTDGTGLDIYTNAAVRMKVEDDKIQLQEDLHFATGAAPTINGGSHNPLTIYGNSDGTATSTTNNVVTRSTSAAIDFDVNTSQQLAMRVKDNKDVDVYGVLSGPGIVKGAFGANSFNLGATGDTNADGTVNAADDWYEVFRWTPNATMSATTSNQYRNFAARFQVVGRGIQRINFDMYVRGEYGVQDSNGWWTKEFIIDGLDETTDDDGNASPDADSIFKMVYNAGTSLSMPYASLYMRRDENWELRTCNLISMFTNCVFEFKDSNVGETTPANDGETGSADLSPTIRRKLRVDANNQVINGAGGTGIYFDDTNDRLGIGTAAPETVLHLETSSGQIAQLGTGNSAYSMHFADDRAMFGHVGGFATVQGGTGGKAVRFCVNNGTFGSGEVARFDTSGNFGIGTTAPDQKLHVEGSILADAYNSASTTLASNYTDGATSMVLTDASEFPTAGSGTINGVAFTWTNKSSNTLTVPDLDASYTAGVTVVADTGLFFRDGFENVAQPSVTIYDKDNSGASRDDLSINANAGIRFRLGNESQMQLTADQLSLTTGNQGAAAIFGFRDRTDMGIKSNTSYSVGVLAPDNVFIQTDSNNNGNANYIDFGHGSNSVGSAESMMRIVMGGTTGPGKVGIGTTSPSTELHVSGADHPSIRVTGTDNAGADPAIELLGTADNFTEGGQLWYDNGTGVLHLSSLYNNDAADIQFHTKTAADRSTSNVRMTIAGDGKVGIGTTSPTASFDVSQGGANSLMTMIVGADLGATTRTNDARKFFRMGMPHYHNAEEPFNLLCGDSSGTQNKVIIGGGTSLGNAATDILFNTAANDATTTGTTRMQIKSDGKVGIGTTSPSVPLEVNGEIKGSKINLSSGTDAFTIQSSNPLREKKIYATTSGDGSPFDEMVFHSEGSTGGWSGQHTFTVSKSEDDDPDVFSPYTAFRIRDSGNGTSSEVLVSHKLGVGILDPVPMFHIYGNNSTTNQTTSGAASITIENDGAGDAALNFLLTGTRRWIAGIDNSDGDKFKISTGGTDLQTGTKLTIDTSGNAVIAGDVQAATASITGLMTSGTALINSSHSFSNTPAITTNGATINGTNTTKVRAESSTYSFSQSYTLVGNLNNSTELELFRFNVTNASYRKFQAGRMFIRVQVTNPQSGGSGFFQQTVTFGDDASAGAAQSTTDRIDSSMTGGNAAYDHEKATIVVSRVSDYICVKFRNETGVAILTSSGFQAQLSCELFELDAMPS
tara:strand:- start:21562 stop:25890 length:4329 start_codon:yes stop_codon:yes gene_type:complete